MSGVEAQCCFTSTETIRTMRVVSGVLDLYIAGTIFAMVLKLSVALRPQTIGTISVLCLVLKFNVALLPQTIRTITVCFWSGVY